METERFREGTLRVVQISCMERRRNSIWTASQDYSYSFPRKAGSPYIPLFLPNLRENNLVILESFGVKNGKTKEIVSLLRRLNLSESTLIVCDGENTSVYIGGRNLGGSCYGCQRD